MEIIIDIQPSFDRHYIFTPKEVGVLSLEEDTYAHWLVKPPHDFTQLNAYLQRTNNTLTRFVHGIEWFNGDLSVKHVEEHLKAFVKNASQIYSVGETKCDYLSKLLGRKIIDLEKYKVPSYSTLDFTYKNEVLTSCMYHKACSGVWRNCTLHKAGLLREWLRDLIKKYKHSTKKVVSSNLARTVFERAEDEDETLEILDIYVTEVRKTTDSEEDASFYEDAESNHSDETVTELLKDDHTADYGKPIEPLTPDGSYKDVSDGLSTIIENKENINSQDVEVAEESPLVIDLLEKENEHVPDFTRDQRSTCSHSRGVSCRSYPEGVDETDGASH